MACTPIREADMIFLGSRRSKLVWIGLAQSKLLYTTIGGQAVPDPLQITLYWAFAVILLQSRIIWLLLTR
jgi:hypothetical protein